MVRFYRQADSEEPLSSRPGLLIEKCASAQGRDEAAASTGQAFDRSAAFHKLSGDPEQDYFADGMVEEIITGRARVGCKIRSRRKRKKGRSSIANNGTAYRCDDGSAPVGGPLRR